MLDLTAIQRTTGWTLHHRVLVASTNDEAARLRDAGSGPHSAILADEQARGRGRAGHDFVSPPGGLYLSMLLAAHPEDLPGPITGAVALATAQAIEQTTGVSCGIKWPNDLWVGRRKLAGILLEAAGPQLPVIAGLGLNVEGVPEALPADLRRQTTALDLEAGRPTDWGALLIALLGAVDRATADLRFPEKRAAIERAWHARLLFLGERVTYEVGSHRHLGILRDASLDGGLWFEDEQEGRVLRRAEHVRELRPVS